MFTLNNHRLLIIAPHPDDEVLGCAGLIQKVKHAGGKVYVLFLTVADTEDFSQKGFSGTHERKEEIDEVASFLKFDDYQIIFEGDRFHLKLDLVGQHELMNQIERKSRISLEKVKPTILAFPQISSYNQDHKMSALAAFASVRPAQKQTKHFVPYVISYEMPVDAWSLTGNPVPNLFVPLTKGELAVKLEAWKMYKSQLRPPPNPRSPRIIEDLAVLRGSLIGHFFAEAFHLLRGEVL
ncbi:hypothetical protein A3D05_02485 [Candidatus Gottesmanbacteria bacterium RIFCSPHIGHO2_02_FULL_40_24]|uniref:GlcNAc-PI de-N-acetylase n=1 Tax=Candidatus Gottesmanbacteria bacterium RIFCSPHIGHO2_01_FULL_40_15 TaxID=1798376 RepID=A0A1F5Z6E8_9BACT|nr:MAG: hypothetical protein A2777_00490 [Candidatus Gottesmanbacteria bacterium RIFCSPHIGHO2_01_FULL_40_15]OGG18718.1 MAG: hypothetical protein A3D05_02485 [Candidatus Gottesmanbacteria bacterium RIFCSPHIGHO2_02_FULL_40_24]OGG23009.1 MAG: hypothetical protein A3E42_06695 [Candidatus Gottesmanbacteria bacterium RIFCSPHIGHO2_12_FULL_40_13]OGG31928.1 MAG: hypothetical protein A3I80_02825 [Candidatus Gottesmanbacteria bacterium RIFCSPLOWO2_02_FULL_40_10]